MTIDQLTADTIELATWARDRYASNKVHILGHSADGTLALLAAHRAPTLCYSVFALSPHVSIKRSAPITYRALLARAEWDGNAQAITELRDLGEPLYRNLRQGVETQAKWVAAFDHLVFGGSERANELFSRWPSIPGYKVADHERAYRGLEFSSRLLFGEGMAIDLFDRCIDEPAGRLRRGHSRVS